MARARTRTAPKPDRGTVTVLYEEVRRTIDQQFDQVERLNGRAAQLLGFATVIISVVGAFNTDEVDWTTKAFVIAAIALFSLGAAQCAAAWRFLKYRDDPHVEKLYEHYAGVEETNMRNQIIGNRFAAIKHNDDVIARKRAWIGYAFRALALGYVVLVGLVLLTIFR